MGHSRPATSGYCVNNNNNGSINQNVITPGTQHLHLGGNGIEVNENLAVNNQSFSFSCVNTVGTPPGGDQQPMGYNLSSSTHLQSNYDAISQGTR